MKTILATTYAVNPYKGSEDGMGWHFVNQIARFNRIIAITRENNRQHIERFMRDHPDSHHERIQFLYFDLPYWMRFWKKGGRGAMLYYWMWQQGVLRFIRRQNLEYDIVHNLNFHNDWTPSHLWKLERPFVWGPIGHHPAIPNQYLKPYARKYWIQDRLRWWIKRAFWQWSSALKQTTNHAGEVLCMNPSVCEVIDLSDQHHRIMPSVATEDFGFGPVNHDDIFTVISAGRLVPLKGFDLTIRSFARFIKHLPKAKRSECQLLIVGSGPEESFYREMVREEGMVGQVKFISWIERSELLQLYRKASTFLFPSHEGAGMVVAEALSFGLPVICLDNAGPGAFLDDTCGYRIKMKDYDQTVSDLACAIEDLYKSPARRKQMAQGARERFVSHFHWDRRGEALQEVYQNLGS